MTRLARFVLRHRLAVVLFWLVTFLGGFGASAVITDRLSLDFSLPGQDGYETSKQIVETYGTESEYQYLLVIESQNGSRLDEAQTAAAFAAVQRDVPSVRLVDKAVSGGDPIFQTTDGNAQFAYAFLPRQQSWVIAEREPLKASLEANAPEGTTGTITGLAELATGGETESDSGVWVETALGGLGALAVLSFVFASVLALVPLFIAAVSILTTFLIVVGLTYLTDISAIVQYLIALVGLGVAVDYSLLVVSRWREERDHGRSNEEAVITSMQFAGHAVVFSGCTVAISLFALVILPVPFLQSIGLAGLLIPLISVATTVTLLPVLLSKIGPRVDWPKIRHENRASKFWTAWGKGIVRHRVLAALSAVVLLTLLIVPATTIKIGNASSESLAKSGPGFEASQALFQGGVPKGVLTPMEVLSSDDAAPAVVTEAKSIDGIATAFAETGPVGQRDGSALTLVIPEEETANATSTQPVKDLKNALEDLPGVVGVAGVGPGQLDFLNGVYGNFPLALAIILLVTYVLLARAFRSLLLPLKAVILNIASLVATYGALVLFWQNGYGSEAIYGIEPTGAITFWIPIMVFAFLFGLSMDYEVFILSRIREEWDRTHNTAQAVIVGTGRTGRLVTSAALILFLAFVALGAAPGTDTKLMATGLGFGILLDATIVRMLLVPALVSVFGKWNWYLPNGVAKLLRVEPSPLQPDVQPSLDIREGHPELIKQ